MLTALTVLVLLGPPPTDGPVVVSEPGQHAAAAHQKLRMDVRVRIIPNLRSYEALSKDVLEQMGFAEKLKGVMGYLDGIRNSSITSSLEKTIPGFPWLTTAYDSLRKLAARVEATKTRLSALERMSAELLKAANRYTDGPSDENFQSLMRGFEDGKQVFLDAREAFDELDSGVGTANKALGKAGSAVDAVRKLPFVGERYDPLRDDIDGLVGRFELLRQVVKLTSKATERDTRALTELRGTLDDAHAHDAYEAARRFADQGQPGSAMAAFREVRHTWPDTQWAHRSDRRIVELTAHIDRLQSDLAAANSELTRVRLELKAAVQKLAAKPVVAAAPAEVTQVAAAAQNTSVVWAMVAGIGVLLLGALVWSRQR